ncbi:MAG TPA: hypothetical protein VHP11_10685, partial [Tepidisphaeraceae bacterium]|nr:hypothetical protein [Tepidisphaeraceae bacterium]
NANPLAGLMDTVVLVTLTREASDTPAVRQTLGGHYESVMTMLRSQEATAWLVAARFLTPDQLDELRKAIENWRSANPDQRFISHVRLVDFEITHPLDARARRPGSIFSLLFLDPLARIDPAVREIAQSRDIAERVFFYGQRMSLILSWRVEMQIRQTLASRQVTKLQTQLASFDETSRRFTDIAGQFSKSFEMLPAKSDKIVEQATTRISAEREAAIEQATTQVSAEREAAIKQMVAGIQTQGEEAVRNVEAALDRSTKRIGAMLLQVAIITILTFFGSLLAYRLLLRIIARHDKAREMRQG